MFSFRSATVVLAFILFGSAAVSAQSLKPGFDADEYIGVLQRCALQVNSNYRGNLPKQASFEKAYFSPELGLHNKYHIWVNKEKTIITITLRGTTSDMDSWLANFYSAMIPATGTLMLDGKTPFNYKFANDPKALVHVGWTVGICSLIPDIVKQLEAWYGKGVKQVMVEGHSQGGALAFLLTSYLHYQVADGKLPQDLVVKTYCSAAPKPGNLYYAYDFDFITRGGWAFTVVNTRDWVPELPVTVQTKNDINNDPFGENKENLKKQSFLVRWYLKHIYNKLDRSTHKAQRKYEKYLGRVMYKQVRKYLKEYRQPEYAHSCNYARAGSPIVLQGDSAYARRFPDTSVNIFRHHLFEPYYYLVTKTYK